MPNEPWGDDTAKLWRVAWGFKKAMVVTEYNQRLPKPPNDYALLITRDIDIVRKVDAEGNEKVDVFPKVEVSLLHVPDDPDGFKTMDYGTIDVKMHGESSCVALAENILVRRGMLKPVR